MRGRFAVLSSAMASLIVAACSSTPAAAPSPSPVLHAASPAGGCAGTRLSLAEPPAWSQGGWSHQKGTPWPVPWAMSSASDAVAFVFATELVAGGSPRADGSSNKVLWVARDAPGAFVVDGSPLGRTAPVISIPGGPSIVDVPTAGCWTFTVRRTAGGATRSSVINLQALPRGALPASVS